MLEKEIEFFPSGRGEAQCPPNPEYPNGIEIPAPSWAKVSCLVKLPYPAPECGWYQIKCNLCNAIVAVTAAGRPDDPVSFRMPCKIGDVGGKA